MIEQIIKINASMNNMTTTPRGIRNCNPLNIRRSAAKWKGLRAPPR